MINGTYYIIQIIIGLVIFPVAIWGLGWAKRKAVISKYVDGQVINLVQSGLLLLGIIFCIIFPVASFVLNEFIGVPVSFPY